MNDKAAAHSNPTMNFRKLPASSPLQPPCTKAHASNMQITTMYPRPEGSHDHQSLFSDLPASDNYASENFTK